MRRRNQPVLRVERDRSVPDIARVRFERATGHGRPQSLAFVYLVARQAGIFNVPACLDIYAAKASALNFSWEYKHSDVSISVRTPR